MSRARHARADKSGALVVDIEIKQSELADITKTLLLLDKNLRRKIIRQSSRHAVKAHLLPQVRRVTPAGGMTSRGRAPFRASGMRYAGQRFHNVGKSQDTLGNPRSTGRLRRSLKVKAIRRSSTGVGTQVQSKFKNAGKAYYGAFLELGWRTFHTGRRIPGEWRWKRVADRRGDLAKRSFIRNMWARVEAFLRKQR